MYLHTHSHTPHTLSTHNTVTKSVVFSGSDRAQVSFSFSDLSVDNSTFIDKKNFIVQLMSIDTTKVCCSNLFYKATLEIVPKGVYLYNI